MIWEEWCIESGMRGKLLFLLIISAVTVSSQSHVLLLINESTGETVKLKKKNIRDVLTTEHQYLGRTDKIDLTGLWASGSFVPIENLHSLEVRHGKFAETLARPIKWMGIGVSGLGALMITASLGKENSATGETEYPENAGGLFLGGLMVAVTGVTLVAVSNSMTSRPIEKAETVYYLHQWTVRIVKSSQVSRFRQAAKKAAESRH